MAAGPTADVLELGTPDVITEDRFSAALRACKAGKACGPDRLGNDWYREYDATLVPLLTRLYKLWYSEHCFPTSFLHADIFCLKKKGDGSNPLNYRPLALLNTDYKILTRLLATQIRDSLASQINAHQNGFVPFRDIHATIDYLEAAQRMATLSPELRESLVLLLDFAKAYDSLDRRFLYATLQRHGYPPHFICVVESLHAGTTVRFLANGERSRYVAVTRGIRQGCPLAPLLFILALEPLYQKLDSADGLLGITLQTAEAQALLKVAGYADDTALYLRSPEEIPRALEIVQGFGAASGLRLNIDKTVPMALHEDGLSPPLDWRWGIQLLDPSARCRYLGMQIGSKDQKAATWNLAETHLRTRLRLASHKTLSVEQRAQVVAAVVIPNLLFIGRHAWPTTATVRSFNAYIKAYVWHGYFGQLEHPCTTWLVEDVSKLPKQDGGFALPDLQAELLAMAATTVLKWGRQATLAEHLVGDILHPREPTLHAPRVFVTPGSSGRTKMLTLAGLQDPADVHGRHVAAQYAAVEAAFQSDLQWHGGFCTVDVSGLLGQSTARLREFWRVNYGRLHFEWLPYAEVRHLLLFDASGHRNVHDLLPREASAPGRSVRHVIDWTILRAGVLEVRNVSGASSTTIRMLLVALIANYPDLLYYRHDMGEMQLVATPSDHPIIAHANYVSGSEPGCLLTITAAAQGPHTEVLVHSQPAALQELRRFAGPDVDISSVLPDPALSRVVMQWTSVNCTRDTFKRVVLATSRRHGAQDIDGRKSDWKADHPAICAALTKVDWLDLRRITEATVWSVQVLYRLKLRAFSYWDAVHGRPGCPLPVCFQSATAPWQAIGMGDLQSHLADIFELDLSIVPAGVWELLDTKYASESEAARHNVRRVLRDSLQDCWRLGVVLTLHAIWKWRSRCRDPVEDMSAHRATALLSGRLAQGYLTLRERVLGSPAAPHIHPAARLAHAVLTAGGGTTPEYAAGALETSTFLLFFDGGSRGNPGPGGSGSVIIRVGGRDLSPVVMWMASVSYAAHTTTNNVAEYRGLLVGLRRALAMKLTGLHVIGDSKLILTHLARRRPPKAAHLRDIYAQCRTIADQL